MLIDCYAACQVSNLTRKGADIRFIRGKTRKELQHGQIDLAQLVLNLSLTVAYVRPNRSTDCSIRLDK